MPSGIRSFGDAARVAAQREADQEEEILVDILGREIAIQYPGSGQLVYMTSAFADVRDDLDQVGGLMNFIYRLVSREDSIYLQSQLLDPESGFDAEEVSDLIEYLTEEWSSRPTRSASDSSPSQRTPGKSSTVPARRRASTSSTSRSEGSSTTSTRKSSRA